MRRDALYYIWIECSLGKEVYIFDSFCFFFEDGYKFVPYDFSLFFGIGYFSSFFKNLSDASIHRKSRFTEILFKNVTNVVSFFKT